MEELMKYDTEFSESKFFTKVDNIFVMLHVALMTKNLERVKHFISDDIFNEYENILKNLNEKNYTQMYDELNVKSTEIINASVTDDKFIINVKLVSRYMDYIIDSTNKKFISGNNESRVEKVNYLTFEKIRNHKTQGAVRKCPGCGASMDVNNTGKCEYCGTIYNNEDYDYILVSLKN